MTRQSTDTLTKPLDLSGYNDADLLTTAYALTHRLHVAEASAFGTPEQQVAGETRFMRDQITAEVLRRMGGQ